jgi:alpha-glucosidase
LALAGDQQSIIYLWFMRSFLTSARRLPGITVLLFALSGGGLGTELKSPDGQIAIAFRTAAVAGHASDSGRLVYSVTFRGKAAIVESAVWLDLEGQAPLGRDVSIVKADASTIDETYRLVTGKASQVRNRSNALRLDLEERSGSRRSLTIEARAYDDAVAFRYIVPDQAAIRELRLKEEHTEFRLSSDATAYALLLPDARSMYESEFFRMPFSYLLQIGHPGGLLVGLPLLLEEPGVAWLAITEAGLEGNSAMYLVSPSLGTLESKLAPGVREPEICVQGTLPHHSGWRVVQVAGDPGRLIESNVVTSLSPPSAIQDTSWIHAGRSAWDWWSGRVDKNGKPAYTTENMKRYIDFAADAGLEYMLVDAGWQHGASNEDIITPGDITKMNGSVDIPEVVRYAGGKGVKVWIWANWAAVDRQLEEAFPVFQKWGVVGVKIDFMSRDDQEMIGFYYRVAETAARYRLMVDFHGATKPTGMERTWPNVLGYEAVAGMEHAKWSRRDNPGHELMLPFTRMLAGAMDYTPGGFENTTNDEFVARNERPMVMGTRAHQLAMYVVYLAPFQMVSDDPLAYRDQPSFRFIEDVPATWDETRVLNGQPGEFITMARRRGREWFLGSMTNWTARELEVPLSFLGEGRYRAEIYADADDAGRLPKNTSIRTQEVTGATRLKVRLAPGGGLAVRFVPVEH